MVFTVGPVPFASHIATRLMGIGPTYFAQDGTEIRFTIVCERTKWLTLVTSDSFAFGSVRAYDHSHTFQASESMLEYFINPWTLAIGLVGLSLPVLAHLLSKKKYDVVQWGAMQFLELGRNTRRRIRLEELLLMLLRMGLILLLAFALSRPWVSSSWFGGLVSKRSRDVVFVIDGSYSMGWEEKATTPHAAAMQWIHRYLEELKPGDTVALLDARDRVRPVIESPTRDFGLVREQLDKLPLPSGTSNLAEATSKAIQILSRTSNLSREVIVLTDRQALCWSAHDTNLWARIDDLSEQPAIKPTLWIVDVTDEHKGPRINYGLDRLQLSRELNVANFPVRVKSKIRASGGENQITRRVYFEVDGQRLAEKTLTVQLPPGGEATVEFEHRFSSAGAHVLSVVLDDDNLAGDNRADAAIVVVDALPVLLIDGDPHLDATRGETFFAQKALSPELNDTPWIQARVVEWDRMTAADLNEPEVVVLANVPYLTDAQMGALKDFVRRGGGLFVTLGDKVDIDRYKAQLFEGGAGLLPALVQKIVEDEDEQSAGVTIDDTSLEVPWLARFRSQHGGGFTTARFSHWWKVVPVTKTIDAPLQARDKQPLDDKSRITAAVTIAKFKNNDPAIVTRQYQRGTVMLLTSAIDADWSTLPAKPDYVSFLHEVLFQLASGKAVRNVDAGMPLILQVDPSIVAADYQFVGPNETEFPAQQGGNEIRKLIRLNDTRLPGVYTLKPKDGKAQQPAFEPQYFVVNFDRAESDLTPLDEAEIELLVANERATFVKTQDEVELTTPEDAEAKSELWHLLLLCFLAILVGEVFMTRRLVRGGHEVTTDAETPPN